MQFVYNLAQICFTPHESDQLASKSVQHALTANEEMLAHAALTFEQNLITINQVQIQIAKNGRISIFPHFQQFFFFFTPNQKLRIFYNILINILLPPCCQSYFNQHFDIAHTHAQASEIACQRSIGSSGGGALLCILISLISRRGSGFCGAFNFFCANFLPWKGEQAVGGRQKEMSWRRSAVSPCVKPQPVFNTETRVRKDLKGTQERFILHMSLFVFTHGDTRPLPVLLSAWSQIRFLYADIRFGPGSLIFP